MKIPEFRDITNKFMVASAGVGVQVLIPFFQRLPVEDVLNLAAWLYVVASSHYDDQEATDEAFSSFVEKIRNEKIQ